MAHEETDAQVLNSIDSESTNPIPVIYQSGYLTIKGYDEEFGIYRLGFPNREVEEGFIRFLLPYYASVNKVESPFEIQKFVREIRSGDYDSFFRRLQSFFADTTYEVIRDQELHYENVLFIVFKLLGFYTQVEYHTNLSISWSLSWKVLPKRLYSRSTRSIMRSPSKWMNGNYSK